MASPFRGKRWRRGAGATQPEVKQVYEKPRREGAGVLGKERGQKSPTGSSPVPVIPDWKGEEAMCLCRRSLRTFAGPESSGPPTPHPVAVCDCEGLAACLATRRRISGFVDLETQIAPDRQDGGDACWICQDRLRLAAVVVRANEHRLVVVLVRDPVAIRIS